MLVSAQLMGIEVGEALIACRAQGEALSKILPPELRLGRVPPLCTLGVLPR